MDDQEKLRAISEMRGIIAELNNWADEKIESGAPASPTEAAEMKDALRMLRELVKMLKS